MLFDLLLIELILILITGFDELKNAYSPYPDALLYMSFMVSIGSLIVDSKSNSNSLPTYTNTTSEETSKSMQNESQAKENLNGLTRGKEETGTFMTDATSKPQKQISLSLTFKHSIKLYNFLVKKMPHENEDLLEFYLNNIVDGTFELKSENWYA